MQATNLVSVIFGGKRRRFIVVVAAAWRWGWERGVRKIVRLWLASGRL